MIKLLYFFSTEKLKEMKKKKQHQNGADDGVGIICASKSWKQNDMTLELMLL